MRVLGLPQALAPRGRRMSPPADAHPARAMLAAFGARLLWSRSGGAAAARAGSSAEAPTGVPPTSTPRVPPTPAPALPPPATAPEHLVLLVSGLNGSRHNWRAIGGFLAAELDPAATLLHASTASERGATYEGVDACGRRLATEIEGLAAAHPSLRRLSVVGHSMGGLVARFALGALFEPERATVAGLALCHFVSLATPHLGCAADPASPACVPMLAWGAAAPAAGPGLGRLLAALAAPVSAALFSRTGRQFFFADDPSAPLIRRLAADDAAKGLRCLSALAAFETRTAYANRSGDHLVGWANSSLRRPAALPPLAGRGRGVVREDPLGAAWAEAERPAGLGGAEDAGPALPAAEAPGGAGGAGGRGDALAAAAAAPPTGVDRHVEESLAALEALPWRRVDVCFAGAALPFMAHQHLQVQRWLNWEGRATARHLAASLAAMEAARAAGGGAPAAAAAEPPAAALVA
jgi:hypothetical protein